MCDLEGEIFEREIENEDGKVIRIGQLLEGDVGCVVWDAALVLCHFLDSNNFQKICETTLKGKKVLELGAGTGIVGLQAAILGAESIITDLKEFVPLMKLNIQNNQHLVQGSIEALPLIWGDDPPCNLPSLDFILLSDCLYYNEGVNPLIKSLGELCTGHTTVIFCYEVRSSEQKLKIEHKFFELIREKFRVEEIPREKHHPTFNSEDIKIFKFHRL